MTDKEIKVFSMFKFRKGENTKSSIFLEKFDSYFIPEKTLTFQRNMFQIKKKTRRHFETRALTSVSV